MRHTKRRHHLLPSLLIAFSLAAVPFYGCNSNDNAQPFVKKAMAPEPQRSEQTGPKKKSSTKKEKHKLQSFAKNEWVYV